MKTASTRGNSARRPVSMGLALTGLALLPLTACASDAPKEFMGEAPRSEIGSREASYAVATSPEELKRLVAEDLEAQSANGVYAGLEAFVGENISRRTATRAHLIWETVRPTTMLQYGQGRSVMTGVKQLGDLLGNAGEKEMETAFESLRQGDFQEVQRLRDEPMGIFHPSTAAMSREVRPYAMLADGVLSYRDVAAGSGSEAELEAALTKLSQAQSELAKIGETKGMFLADAAAAQALERAGQVDAAAEYWMRIADSDEFLAQPDVMRHLVAARIKTYGVRMKERLIVEVEAERRAELRARDAQYSVQVDKLSDKHRSFDAWARQGFQSAAKRMADLSAEDDAAKAQIVALAATAESRDAELGRAADALAIRLSAVDQRADGLAQRADAQDQKTAALGKRADGFDQRADSLDQKTGSLDQRAGSLEQRADDLAAATGDVAGRVDGLDARTDELTATTDDLAAAAGGLTAEAEAVRAQVDREVAQLRGSLNQAVASLRTDQAGLAARAEQLESRATALAQSSGANSAEIAALNTEAAQLRQQASALQVDAQGSARARQKMVSQMATSDADLAQALQDLASYQAAVDELTATSSLDALSGLEDIIAPAEAPESGSGMRVASASGGVMSVPAYLAVHSVQDVFGVDGQMQQLTAFFMPK